MCSNLLFVEFFSWLITDAKAKISDPKLLVSDIIEPSSQKPLSHFSHYAGKNYAELPIPDHVIPYPIFQDSLSKSQLSKLGLQELQNSEWWEYVKDHSVELLLAPHEGLPKILHFLSTWVAKNLSKGKFAVER